MKPLSPRQREVLQKMKDGRKLFVLHSLICFVENGSAILDAERVSLATQLALVKSGHIRSVRGLPVFTITQSGLTALAKKTRNRGKKQKPDLGDVHKQIIN